MEVGIRRLFYNPKQMGGVQSKELSPTTSLASRKDSLRVHPPSLIGEADAENLKGIQGKVRDKADVYAAVAAAAAAATEAVLAVSNNVATLEDRSCPPYREELGRATWTLLHTTAAYIPERPSRTERSQLKEFMHHLSVFYPCKECAREFREILHAHPPNTHSREQFSQWMCMAHNLVNKRLGKPNFDCSHIMERWKDGWRDGSCDY